jgi:hypothetical protein
LEYPPDAHHVIAAAVFLDRHVALGTLFRVRRNPIRRLRVVITFLDPLAKETALNGLVPLFSALEAEDVAAFALNRTRFDVLNLHGVAAVSWRTPTQQTVAFDETVGDELLVLGADARLCQEIHHGDVVNQDITAMSSACNGLAQSLFHDFCREVPAAKKGLLGYTCGFKLLTRSSRICRSGGRIGVQSCWCIDTWESKCRSPPSLTRGSSTKDFQEKFSERFSFFPSRKCFLSDHMTNALAKVVDTRKTTDALTFDSLFGLM